MNTTAGMPFAIPAEWPSFLAEDTLYSSIGRKFLAASTLSHNYLGGMLTHTLFTFIIFWPTYIAFYSFHRAVDKHNMFGLQKYKLHPHKTELQELNDKVTTGLWHGFWKGAVRTGVVYWIWFSHGRQNMTSSFPTLGKLVIDILFGMVLNDIIFYWFHRLEHHPKLYKRWHKQHHEYKITNVGATSWNNPEESFGIMCIANTIAWMLNYDLFTWTVSVVIGVWGDMHVHAGYRFPYNPLNLLMEPELHDYHHYQNAGMYSVSGWDTLFGTDKNFKAWKARQEERRREGLEEEAERRDESSGWLELEGDKAKLI